METLEAFKSDLEVLEKLRKKRLDFIKELWQCFFPNNDGMPQIPMRLGARLNKDIAAWIVRDFILEPVFVCIIQSLHTGHLSTNRNLLIDQIKEFGSSPLVIVRDIAARTSEFAIGILATDKLQADGTDGPEFIGKLLEIMIEDTSEVGGIIAEASARNAKGDAGGNISIEEISLEEYTTSVTNSFGELIKVLKELLSTGGSDSTIEPLAVHKLLPMMPFLQGRLEIIAEETLLHFTINLLNTITDNPSILTEIVNKASDVTYPRDLLSSEIMKLCFPTGSKEIAIYGSALQELIHEKLRKKVETYLIPRLAIKPKLELIRQESPQQDIDTAQSAAKLVARMAISKAENALSAPREFLAQQGENITSQITSTLKPLGELVSQTAFDSFSLNLEPQLTNWIAVLGEDSERIARRLKPLPAIISEPIQNTTEELLLVAMKNAKILLKKLYATDQDFIQKMLQDLCQPIKTHPAFDKGPEAIEEAQMEHARKWSAKLLPILIPLDSLPTPQKLSVQAYEQLRDNILPKILITAIKSLLEPANVSSMLIKALDEKSSTKKKTNTASQHLSFQEKLSLAFKGIKNDLGSFFTLNKTENIIKPMGKTKIIGKTAFSLVKKFFLINWAAALINKIIYIPQIILNKLGLLEETKDSEQILGEAISIQLRKSLSEYPIDTIIDKILNASKEWMNNELDKTDEQIQIEKENEKEITASLHQKAIEMLSKTLQRPFKISLEAIWDGLSSLLLKASQKIEEKIASVPIGFPILKNIPGIRNFRWIQTTKISQAASRLWNIFIVKLLDILIVKLPKPAIISIDRLILKPARTFLNIVSLGYLKRTI